MDLPRPLHSWRPYLALFPRDLALSLGPLLLRLAAAVGPVSTRQAPGGGQVDGFSGLARRGSYERLLPTEWLLADEAPLEFLRRAAQGEHTFFDLARPRPRGGRLSVAAFDAGPSQLGAPRIAQLAALVVLARRAEAAGVRFGWGILQEPEGPLFSTVTEAGVLRLLEARTAREATAADLAAWDAKVAGWSELDDFWAVGGARLAALPRLARASRIEIRDPLEAGVRRVDLSVHLGGERAGRRRADVSLELPADADCARLLRDPFGAASPGPRRVAGEWTPLSGLVFSGNGAKIFARTEEGFIVYVIPNSARAGTPPATPYRWPGEPLVGLGFARREVMVVAMRQGQVSLHAAHRNGGVHWGGSYSNAWATEPFIAPEADAALAPCFRIGERTFVLDGARSLFELQRSPRNLFRLATGVAAWTHYGGGIALLAAASDARPAILSRLVFDTREKTRLQPVAHLDRVREGTGTRVFFGFGGRGLSHAHYGLLASERGDGEWALLYSQGTRVVAPPAGTQVVGVGRSFSLGQPGLVVLGDDARTFTLVCPRGTVALPAADAPVEEAAVSHAGPHLAYRTAAGEVAVVSLDSQTVTARWVPEGRG